MGDMEIIDLTPENIACFGVCGYKDQKKHAGLERKIHGIINEGSMTQ